MYPAMADDLLIRLTLLVIGAILFGALLCVPLYGGDIRRLLTSSLWTKIIWWLPIYGLFLLILVGGPAVAVVETLGILLLAAREYRAHPRTALSLTYVWSFAIIIWSITAAYVLIPSNGVVAFLVSVAVMSVFSDVVAFFFGQYLPKHRLPACINGRKSWEGVAGQIVGAVIGAAVVISILGLDVSIWFALVIGIASATGDLFNSAAKRSLGIKDWGRTIPGHGGVLDRLSSLGFAFAAAVIFAVLAGPLI